MKAAWASVLHGWSELTTRARVAVAILAAMIALSVIVPLLSPYDPLRGTGTAPLAPPSPLHPFGTDHLGRDVFVRSFAAARADLLLASVAVAVSLLAGTLVGSFIGSTRNRFVRWAGDVSIEAINAFPAVIIVIALIAAVGTGPAGVLLALLLTAWARYATVARARARVVSDMPYTEIARGIGYSRLRILAVHIVPNVLPVTRAYAASHFVEVIVAIAALSFLGAGFQPPSPEWGAMMSDGRLDLTRAAWPVLFPGVLLSLTAIAVSALASERAGGVREGVQ